MSRFLFNLFAAYATWSHLIHPTFAHPAPTKDDKGKKSIHVRAGDSIQAAINSASPGTHIKVSAGTYVEQLTITISHISLTAEPGTTIIPPTASTQNLCYGLSGPDTITGICIHGTAVELAPYVAEHRRVLSVGHPVTGVSVSGFEINGFSGENIAVVGAEDTKIYSNKLRNGVAYGFLAAGSVDTHVKDNSVSTEDPNPGFIAICTDDKAGARVSGNKIDNYAIGLCIQTPGSELKHNEISNCCVGAFLDPYVKGVKLLDNTINPTDPACVGLFPFASGVIVDGAVNSLIKGNVITGQHFNGTAAGIGIIDDYTRDPVAVSSGNIVTANFLSDNDLDLYVNTTGTGNVATGNQCVSSVPEGLCA